MIEKKYKEGVQIKKKQNKLVNENVNMSVHTQNLNRLNHLKNLKLSDTILKGIYTVYNICLNRSIGDYKYKVRKRSISANKHRKMFNL